MKQLSKKLLLPLAVPAAMLALGLSTSAAVGDTVGKVYPTDIKTYFFGSELNSYNIGGYTVIVVEDLLMLDNSQTPPIYVTWNGDDRTLFLKDTGLYPGYYDNPYAAASDDLAKRGTPAYTDGYFAKPAPTAIYETDIKTIIDTPYGKKEIDSYNIGGQTCIVVEDLLNYGYQVIWDGEARELRVSHRFDNVPAVTDIGNTYLDGHIYGPNLVNDTMTVTAGTTTSALHALMVGGYNYNSFVELNGICEALGITYTFDGHSIAFDASNAAPFTYTILRDSTLGEMPQAYDGLLYTLDIDSYTVNGVSVKPTYKYWFGHMASTQQLTADYKFICYSGKVYVPADFVNEIITAAQTPAVETAWTLVRSGDALTISNGLKTFSYSPTADKYYKLEPQLSELSACTLVTNGSYGMLTYPIARESDLDVTVHSAILIDLNNGQILNHYDGHTMSFLSLYYGDAITPVKKANGTHPGYSITATATVDGKGFDLNYTFESSPKLVIKMRCDILDPSLKTTGRLVPELAAADETSVELLSCYETASELVKLYTPESGELAVDMNDFVIENGVRYAKVTDRRALDAIASKQSYIDSLGWTATHALVNALSTDIDSSLASKLIHGSDTSTPSYIDHNGELYKVIAERGVDYRVGVTLKTLTATSNSAELELTAVSYGDSTQPERTYPVSFVKISNTWKCSQLDFIY